MYISAVAHLRNHTPSINAAILKLYGSDIKGKGWTSYDATSPHGSISVTQTSY